MSQISIFACGGCGINLGKQLLKFQNTEEEGYSDLKVFFIDTSKSNFGKVEIPEDQVYLLDGLDGSGKKRDSNYAIISEKTKEIVNKFKHSDLNIVIHSASGGSGSTSGPVLVGELVKKAPTVVIIVGSTDSRIETDNTIKTLKSYEVISKRLDLPIPALYYENSKTTPRAQIDNEIKLDIVLLSILFSGDNEELDSADLNNFLNYNKVTSYESGLSNIRMVTDIVSSIEKNETVASVATLTNTSTDSSIDVFVEYQAVGFINENAEKKLVNVSMPIHAVNVLNYFNPLIERLEAKRTDFDDFRAAIHQKTIINKEDDNNATKDGLLF